MKVFRFPHAHQISQIEISEDPAEPVPNRSTEVSAELATRFVTPSRNDLPGYDPSFLDEVIYAICVHGANIHPRLMEDNRSEVGK